MTADEANLQTGRDGRMVTMLVCIFALAITALFGAEALFMMRMGNYATPLVAVISYIITTLFVRRLLVAVVSNRPQVLIGGKKVRLGLAPAIPRLRSYVRARAAELGIEAQIDTYYVRGSWRIVDAYVFGSGRQQTLVVTAGMQALFTSRDPGAPARFGFIIDHELGHISGQDTSLLFLARAALITAAMFLPVKLYFAWQLGAGILATYEDILPSPVMILASPNAIIGYLCAYTLAAAVILLTLYVSMIKRREFVADRFALLNSPDRVASIEAMKSLLHGESPASFPMHAFLGSLRWHPAPRARIALATKQEIATAPELLSIIVMIMTLITVRLTLGVTANPREGPDMLYLVPLSVAFALLTGAVIDSFLEGGNILRTPTGRFWSQMSRLLNLVLWTTVSAAAIAFALDRWTRPGVDDFLVNARSGFEQLVFVEQTERALLILSFPVTVLLFGTVFVVLGRLQPVVGNGKLRIAKLAIGSGLAVLLLWGLSQAGAAQLQHYRAERYVLCLRERIDSLTGIKAGADEQTLKKLLKFFRMELIYSGMGLKTNLMAGPAKLAAGARERLELDALKSLRSKGGTPEERELLDSLIDFLTEGRTDAGELFDALRRFKTKATPVESELVDPLMGVGTKGRTDEEKLLDALDMADMFGLTPRPEGMTSAGEWDYSRIGCLITHGATGLKELRILMHDLGISQSPEAAQLLRQYQQLGPEEFEAVRSCLQHELSPPLAFVSLWQGPLRAVFFNNETVKVLTGMRQHAPGK